jgi:hypothetical protein
MLKALILMAKMSRKEKHCQRLDQEAGWSAGRARRHPDQNRAVSAARPALLPAGDVLAVSASATQVEGGQSNTLG